MSFPTDEGFGDTKDFKPIFDALKAIYNILNNNSMSFPTEEGFKDTKDFRPIFLALKAIYDSLTTGGASLWQAGTGIDSVRQKVTKSGKSANLVTGDNSVATGQGNTILGNESFAAGANNNLGNGNWNIALGAGHNIGNGTDGCIAVGESGTIDSGLTDSGGFGASWRVKKSWSFVIGGNGGQVDAARSIALGGLNNIVTEDDTAQAQNLRITDAFRILQTGGGHDSAAGIVSFVNSNILTINNSLAKIGDIVLVTSQYDGINSEIFSASITVNGQINFYSTNPISTRSIAYLLINQ